jgi:hypothetical protein
MRCPVSPTGRGCRVPKRRRPRGPRRAEAALGDTQDGWFRFERGFGAEQTIDDGDTTLGNLSDETPQRGQYKQWSALMTAEG